MNAIHNIYQGQMIKAYIADAQASLYPASRVQGLRDRLGAIEKVIANNPTAPNLVERATERAEDLTAQIIRELARTSDAEYPADLLDARRAAFVDVMREQNAAGPCDFGSAAWFAGIDEIEI